MAIRIFIDQGHNPSGPNTGAEGNGLREQDVNYIVGVYLADMLRACGSSADVGLNEQKDHAEGKPRFQSWGNPSLRHRRYPSAQLSISREQTAHPAKAPPVLFYPPCPRA